ncbi:MAG: universal stress protein [Bacteroidetes bacterium]|nr:universal stress protein [Bacteroidota bacterium]
MDLKYSKILVGFDHSPSSTVALEKAMEIAKKYGGEIHVVYVENGGHYLDWDSVHDYLDHLREKTGLKIHIHHQKGRAFKEIVHVERDIHADLILVGTHSHSGFMPFWIGSTAFRVVSSSKCPVITMLETAKDTSFKNLIVPIVDSPESRQKLSYAADMASHFGGTVHILCLDKGSDPETEHRLVVYCKQAVDFMKNRNIPYTYEVQSGVNVPQTIIDFAVEKKGGMIFMMTETESAGVFMGTVAQQLINHSPVPVMAIHNHHVEGTGGGGY